LDHRTAIVNLYTDEFVEGKNEVKKVSVGLSKSLRSLYEQEKEESAKGLIGKDVKFVDKYLVDLLINPKLYGFEHSSPVLYPLVDITNYLTKLSNSDIIEIVCSTPNFPQLVIPLLHKKAVALKGLQDGDIIRQLINRNENIRVIFVKIVEELMYNNIVIRLTGGDVKECDKVINIEIIKSIQERML